MLFEELKTKPLLFFFDAARRFDACRPCQRNKSIAL